MIHFTIKNPSFMKVPSQIHQITSLRFSLRYFLPHLSQYKICLPLKKIKKKHVQAMFLTYHMNWKEKIKKKKLIQSHGASAGRGQAYGTIQHPGTK